MSKHRHESPENRAFMRLVQEVFCADGQTQITEDRPHFVDPYWHHHIRRVLDGVHEHDMSVNLAYKLLSEDSELTTLLRLRYDSCVANIAARHQMQALQQLEAKRVLEGFDEELMRLAGADLKMPHDKLRALCDRWKPINDRLMPADMPAEVRRAIEHVRTFLPDVTAVAYMRDKTWRFLTCNGLLPSFPNADVDISILYAARNAVRTFPCVFELPEES